MSWAFVFQICDIAINWAGGLHHAKKFEVSEEVMGETAAPLGWQSGDSWVEELFLFVIPLYYLTIGFWLLLC